VYFPATDLVVCGLLVVSAILRVSPRYRRVLMYFSTRFGQMMLVFIGLVHGMTNMGGGLLDAYVSSRLAGKLEIRQGIACGYAILALSQLSVLIYLHRFAFSAASLLPVAVTILVFVTVGRLAFSAIRQARYQAMISALMMFAALALVAKRALV